MPIWITTAIGLIGPATTVAQGLVTLAQQIEAEIVSSDDPATKASTIAREMTMEAETLAGALIKNTKAES